MSYFQVIGDGAHIRRMWKTWQVRLAVTAHIAAGHGLSGFAGIFRSEQQHFAYLVLKGITI